MLESFLLLNPAATGPQFFHDPVGERVSDSFVSLTRSGTSTPDAEFLLSGCGEDESTFHVSIPYNEWTPSLQSEFVRLAKLSALQKISPAQAKRLEELHSARRFLLNPRTPEEIAWEHKKRMATKALMLALKQYATLHDPANSPWASAKENIH